MHVFNQFMQRGEEMAKYTKENIDTVISSAMETVGLMSLKKEQGDVDAFVALPTGYGKSCCYSL